MDRSPLCTFRMLRALLIGTTAYLVPCSAAIYVPEDVAPGEQYQLVFVTDGTRDALSSDPADYDWFVTQHEAEGGNGKSGALTAGWGIHWYAVVSTSADGDTYTSVAFEHARVSAPVYLLNGTKVADGYAQMWHTHLSPINVTQFGQVASGTDVWSGTESLVYRPECALGTGGFMIKGNLSATDDRCFDAGEVDGLLPSGAGRQMRFYALSEVLTAPTAATPEPTSLCVWSTLGVGMVIASRCRRKEERLGSFRGTIHNS